MARILILDLGQDKRILATFEAGQPGTTISVGDNAYEALGRLVTHHHEELGIEIEIVRNQDEFQRRAKDS